MNNIDLAKLYHFDEMFDNTSKPHSCYKDYYKWLSSEEPGNLKKQQIEANEFFKKLESPLMFMVIWKKKKGLFLLILFPE